MWGDGLQHDGILPSRMVQKKSVFLASAGEANYREEEEEATRVRECWHPEKTHPLWWPWQP